MRLTKILAWIAGISGLLLILASIGLIALTLLPNYENDNIPTYGVPIVITMAGVYMIVGLMLIFGALYFNKLYSKRRY